MADTSDFDSTPRSLARLRSHAFNKIKNETMDTEVSDYSDTEYLFDTHNKENQDGCSRSQNSYLRRSERRPKLLYGTYNQSWIFGGGGPVAPGYPQTARRSLRSTLTDDDELEKGTRRSNRLSSAKKEDLNTSFYESDDMYSRVKRPNLRRQTKRVNYYEKLHPDETTTDRVEPVAMRLRDRSKFAKKNREISNLDHQYIRGKKIRHGSSDSSMSDEADFVMKGPRKPNKTLVGGIENSSFKAQQRQFINDLQMVEVDPSVTFNSIGGLSDHINKLREIALFPLLYKEFYTKRNITPPRGILFYGLPGTGKTLMARALANECLTAGGKKVSFFLRKGADILNRWVGESERQLKVLFEQAALHQPSIIFFDEIDGLAPARTSKSDQVHNSVVSTLLAEMDGVQSRGDVIVIGSTNRIDSLDPALRRPGRFDFEIPFFLPTKEGRLEILKVHLQKTDDCMMPADLLQDLAERTCGYSGADLKLLCSEASMCALRRCYPQIYQSKQKLLVDFDSVQVTKDDWLTSLKTVRPSPRQIEKPLQPQLLPLLGRRINRTERKIIRIFPYKSNAVLEPARKHLLLYSSVPDIIEELIMPGLLHRFESIKIFRLSLHEISSSSSNDFTVVSSVMAEMLHYRDSSILYMPRLDSLYNSITDMARDVLKMYLKSTASSPCLVVATTDENQDVGELKPFFKDTQELHGPNDDDRRAFFAGVFSDAILVKRQRDSEPLPLALAPIEPRVLTDEERRKIEKQENSTLRELRIFLREILGKLGRNKKFVEFSQPVNLGEVPDYGEIIECPMDFELMMARIDAGEYLSAEMFLNDIQLIVRNALNYNPNTTDVDKRIRHRARELQDVAEKLIENEMDSDFEETCKGIIKARQERDTPQIKCDVPTTPPEEAKRSPSKKRRKSLWNRGTIKKVRRDTSSSAKKEEKVDNVYFPAPKARAYSMEMESLLDTVTEMSKECSVFELLEIRYKLFIVVEQHQAIVDKDQLILELQEIINEIS